MQRLRGGKDLRLLGKGPACLTQALGITRAENGLDLCARDSGLWIEQGETIRKASCCRFASNWLGKDSRALAVQTLALLCGGQSVCVEVTAGNPGILSVINFIGRQPQRRTTLMRIHFCRCLVTGNQLH